MKIAFLLAVLVSFRTSSGLATTDYKVIRGESISAL
jgi:hypothetical protein